MLRVHPFLSLLLFTFLGCQTAGSNPRPCDEVKPGVQTCANAGEDRPFDVYLPKGLTDAKPAPLLLLLHGGTGNKNAAIRSSCPGGVVDDPKCLHRMALDRGWVVVSASGTSTRIAKRLRVWNAGGGKGEWQCVAGPGCADGTQKDVEHLDAVIAAVRGMVKIDPKRIYASGLSNGGAMSHRLACERGDVFAAIAPVGGANQFETSAKCEPKGDVSVLQIHGTADKCWTVKTSSEACLNRNAGKKLGADETVASWAKRNGCAKEPKVAAMPDTADDGTTTERRIYQGCKRGDVEYLRIEGHGHAYPDGFVFYRRNEDRVAKDFGSEVIIDFLERHPKR